MFRDQLVLCDVDDELLKLEVLEVDLGVRVQVGNELVRRSLPYRQR